MSLIGALLFWILGALVGGLATIAGLLRQLKEADAPPDGGEAESAPRKWCLRREPGPGVVSIKRPEPR